MFHFKSSHLDIVEGIYYHWQVLPGYSHGCRRGDHHRDADRPEFQDYLIITSLP